MNIKMKNIILIICIFLPMWIFSQKINTDTSLICIPYKVAKKIALDLNKLDSLTEIDKLTMIEIFEIGNKVTIQDTLSQVIDIAGKWIAIDTFLVQTGDIFDKGRKLSNMLRDPIPKQIIDMNGDKKILLIFLNKKKKIMNYKLKKKMKNL